VAAPDAAGPPRNREATATDSEIPQTEIPQTETPVAEDPAGEQPTAVARDAAAPSPAAGTPRGGASRGIVVALLVVSFILEVALLGALGIWGLVVLPLNTAMSLIVTVVPLLVFWAVFMSPKASLRLPQPYHAILAHLLFATGAGLLAIAGQPVLAVCMGVLTAISLALTVAVRGQNVAGGKKATGRRAAR
jgi:hypothetical protein